MCLSAVHLVFTLSDSADKNSFDRSLYRAAKAGSFFQIADSRKRFWVPVIQKVVLSLSDQQLLTGLAVLIAGFWTHCSISVYHFALVNDLAWFSASVHLDTLTVLNGYFRDERHVVQRNWRVALIIVLALLLMASTVMQGQYEWYDSWPYDAQCLFDNLIGNIGGEPRYWMLVSLALICIFYPLSIFPLFTRPTTFLDLWLLKKPRNALEQIIDCLKEGLLRTTSPTFFKGSIRRFTYTLSIMIVRIVSWTYLALMALISSRTCNLILDIFWFVYSLWSIIEDRQIPPTEMNGDENAMSFGQIVPILLLSSIALVFREVYDDQIRDEEREPHHSAPSRSSQISLVPKRSSTIAAAPTASQVFMMAGAIQNTEDDNVEPVMHCPRRSDTEMGGRSHASGLESGQLQRRPTGSVQADDVWGGS